MNFENLPYSTTSALPPAKSFAQTASDGSDMRWIVEIYLHGGLSTKLAGSHLDAKANLVDVVSML